MSSNPPAAAAGSEEAWCDARALDVAQCLARHAVAHGRIGEIPAWHAMPYASIWAVESAHRPEWIGWWVISGDLPSDLIAAQGVETPRAALRAFGERWGRHAQALQRGEVPTPWSHLAPSELPAFSALLRRRGVALQQWADDDASWPSGTAA